MASYFPRSEACEEAPQRAICVLRAWKRLGRVDVPPDNPKPLEGH